MAGPNTLVFNDDNFDPEVLEAKIPVLVDFWAEWCSPCKALGPVVDELATEYAGKVKVGKVDCDANREVSMRFSSTPKPMARYCALSQRFTCSSWFGPRAR